MNRVEFRAGYYEWNVVVDGEHFYTFGDDVSENIPYPCTLDELENVVEDYINCMDIALINDEKESFPNELRTQLKEKMIAVWAYHYGITAT